MGVASLNHSPPSPPSPIPGGREWIVLRLEARESYNPRTVRKVKRFLDPGLATDGHAGLVSSRKLSRSFSKLARSRSK